jgi:hypothetical protein
MPATAPRGDPDADHFGRHDPDLVRQDACHRRWQLYLAEFHEFVGPQVASRDRAKLTVRSKSTRGTYRHARIDSVEAPALTSATTTTRSRSAGDARRCGGVRDARGSVPYPVDRAAITPDIDDIFSCTRRQRDRRHRERQG